VMEYESSHTRQADEQLINKLDHANAGRPAGDTSTPGLLTNSCRRSVTHPLMRQATCRTHCHTIRHQAVHNQAAVACSRCSAQATCLPWQSSPAPCQPTEQHHQLIGVGCQGLLQLALAEDYTHITFNGLQNTPHVHSVSQSVSLAGCQTGRQAGRQAGSIAAAAHCSSALVNCQAATKDLRAPAGAANNDSSTRGMTTRGISSPVARVVQHGGTCCACCCLCCLCCLRGRCWQPDKRLMCTKKNHIHGHQHHTTRPQAQHGLQYA
jgi:hypothetical protein